MADPVTVIATINELVKLYSSIKKAQTDSESLRLLQDVYIGIRSIEDGLTKVLQTLARVVALQEAVLQKLIASDLADLRTPARFAAEAASGLVCPCTPDVNVAFSLHARGIGLARMKFFQLYPAGSGFAAAEMGFICAMEFLCLTIGHGKDSPLKAGPRQAYEYMLDRELDVGTGSSVAGRLAHYQGEIKRLRANPPQTFGDWTTVSCGTMWWQDNEANVYLEVRGSLENGYEDRNEHRDDHISKVDRESPINDETRALYAQLDEWKRVHLYEWRRLSDAFREATRREPELAALVSSLEDVRRELPNW